MLSDYASSTPPLAPVLVGNSYIVDSGTWFALGTVSYSVRWLDGAGRVFARTAHVTLDGGMAGHSVSARVCVATDAASSCVTLPLPGRTQTIAGYLAATCGARRPPPPPYDPNFALLSAPRVREGWNPCHTITWALDDHATPKLSGPPDTTWHALATGAIRQVAAATGITFVERPDFDSPPVDGSFAEQPPDVDLGIGFGALPPDDGGVGGPTAYSGQFASRAAVQLVATPWDAPDAVETLLHELGHAMGLAHPVAEPPAPDPENEVMDPAGSVFAQYQPGDLCGLFEITWQQSCAGSPRLTLGQGAIHS